MTLMDRSDVLTLISVTRSQNDYGVWEETRTKKNVFCQVDSVTRAEFFDAGRNGLNPEYRFTVFAADYNEEKSCVYKGKAYGIYRTYQPRTDYIELYAERKGGTNGQETDQTT